MNILQEVELLECGEAYQKCLKTNAKKIIKISVETTIGVKVNNNKPYVNGNYSNNHKEVQVVVIKNKNRIPADPNYSSEWSRKNNG